LPQIKQQGGDKKRGKQRTKQKDQSKMQREAQRKTGNVVFLPPISKGGWFMQANYWTVVYPESTCSIITQIQ
jgi:hypothetical protein